MKCLCRLLALSVLVVSGCGPSEKELHEIAESLTPTQKAIMMDAYCCTDSTPEACRVKRIPELVCNADGSFSLISGVDAL